jgi:hypothetical protein
MRGAYLFTMLQRILVLVLGRGGARGGGGRRRPENLPDGGEPAATTCRVLLSHAYLNARWAMMAPAAGELLESANACLNAQWAMMDPAGDELLESANLKGVSRGRQAFQAHH